MPKASPGIVSFNAGELSPRLDGRTDLDKYAKGCKTLENMLPLVQGGAIKRSGFRFARETSAFRVVRFSFNLTDSYVLVFGASTLTFMRNNTTVFDSVKTITGATAANPVVITSNSHGFSNGDTVVISGVVGMTELNGRSFTVAGVAANTFQLSGENGTGHTAYVSGGTASRVYTIATPYATELVVESLQFAGQNDVMYIACPTVKPYKLSRFSDASWTLAAVAFLDFPFSPENTDETVFVAFESGTPSEGFTGTLICNNPIFTSATTGSYMKLREIPEAYNPEWKALTDLDAAAYTAFQANGASFEIGDCVQYQGRVYSCSRNAGSTAVTGVVAPVHERGYASDGSDTDWLFKNYGYGYVKITGNLDSNYRATVETIVPIPRSCVSINEVVVSMSTASPIVVTVTNHGWETGDKVIFYQVGGTFGTLVNLNTYTITKTGASTFTIPPSGAGLAGGTSGNVVRLDLSAKTGTGGKIYPNMTRWSWGAWGNDRGFPRAVSFYEDRLGWFGTTSNPQSGWLSVTGDYEDHKVFSEDDSALVLTLSASDPIQWVTDSNALVLGTSAEEFATNRNAPEPLSASTVNTIRVRSRYGSRANVRPVGVENVILFAQRAGRKLRELVWDETQDSLTAPDLTRLSDHVTLGLIKALTFQGEPDRVLWVATVDGQLLGFTYERDEQVFGWHRHPLGGTSAKAISVATIPHPDGDGDQLWAIVERTLGGSAKRSIEYMGKAWTRDMTLADGVFVDSAQTYSGSAATVISSLKRLAGESVMALADGIARGPFTVSAAGSITLPVAATKVHVGLAYEAVLTPMRLEAGAGDGTAQGKVKRLTSVVLRLDQTGPGLYVGPTEAKALQEVRLTAGALYDGDTPLVNFPGGYGFDGFVVVRHTTPLPCTVTAIYPQLNTSDR